jgi:hypothetical protein
MRDSQEWELYQFGKRKSLTGIKVELQDAHVANRNPRLSSSGKECGFRSVRGVHGRNDHERRADLPHELGG